MTLPNSDDLVALLAHRPPFRFVDAVDVLDFDAATVTARYRVTGDEAFLAGHFPGNPIMPGVIQLEALAQTAAILVLAQPEHAGKLPLFGGVENVRWKRIVRPGDEMTMTAHGERMSARGGWANGEVRVDGELACRARLLFAFG